MVIYIIKCSFFPAFKGDRGFDGLAGLPGEKGHRVSILTFNLRGVCLLEFGQQLNMFIFVFTGWTRPPWTSRWSWRGWREGKTKKRKEFHSCPFIFLSTSSAVHTKSHYLNLFCSCTNDFFAGFFPNAPFCHHLNWTSTFSSYFLLLVDFVPYNTFSFFSLQKYLFPISLTFSIKHNWCNLIPHFLCFFIMFSHYTHTHTHLHILTFSSIIIHCLFHSLTCSFLSQGDDGEIGPRGLPGEPVSDHIYYHSVLHSGKCIRAAGLLSSCYCVTEQSYCRLVSYITCS